MWKRRIFMNKSSSTFHELLEEYMKVNYKRLIDIDDEENHLFNMFMAHLMLNYTPSKETNKMLTENELNELDKYLDKMINESKDSFEKVLQILKEND